MRVQRSVPDSRFWTCSVATCSNAASIDLGNCERCLKHFCFTHVSSAIHPCPNEPLEDSAWLAAKTEELNRLRQKINTDILLRLASEANNGIECRIDSNDYPSGASLVGAMHAHIQIRFTDGSTWLARIPRHNFTSFSDELSNEILLSECATLQFLQTARIPAPRLHGYGLHGDAHNEVGVTFMLIDQLRGRPLSQLHTEDQLRHVYGQFHNILTTLIQHPFDQIGSLTVKNGTIQIGPVIGDRTGTLSRLGPFSDAAGYYVAWADEYLRLIADRQLFAQFPIDAYLMFKYLRELADNGRCNGFERELDKGPFFLKHMDDKGDHILVDEDFNLVGIIDWSFARLVPKYEAFGPSLVTACMDDIFTGKPGLSHGDRLLADLLEASSSPVARFARSADRIRCFTFGLGMGMGLSLDEAIAVFRVTVATFDEGFEFDWEKWRLEHVVKWADDEVLSMLLRESG